MIPYYPAVYIGPNGEQFPVGYHPPPMAAPFEHQHPHPHSHSHQHQNHILHQQHQNTLSLPQQQQQQQRPIQQQQPQPQHQQHPQHRTQHQHPRHPPQQHTQARTSFQPHGPTSAPLSFVGSTTKSSDTGEHSTLDTISTPDMRQLESSASLESITSSTTSTSGARDEADEDETRNPDEAVSSSPPTLPSGPISRSPVDNQELAQSPAKASSRSLPQETSHHFDSVPPLPDKPASPTNNNKVTAGALSPSNRTLSSHEETQNSSPETVAQTPAQKGGSSEQGQQQQQQENETHQRNPQDDTPFPYKTNTPPRPQTLPQQQQQQQLLSPNSAQHPAHSSALYQGQSGMSPGSHAAPVTDNRAAPPFHVAGGYKRPFMHPGYPQDYQHAGYYQTSEGWRPAPVPTLQKKPKELDKAMWVGNVLNDTTVAELKAIFEAEPTEAEGNIPHDIPEATVDRAVQRFHDREFKSTRLVCRPRKDPVPDPYSNKPGGPPGRFPQQHHQLHPPHLTDPMGYFNNNTIGITNEAPLLTQRMNSGIAQPELSEVQSRLERMRLEGSPLLDSSSSGGEGSSPTGSRHSKRKPKSSHKKLRSSSSLGYAESRYFIMKSLNEEDLKLSAQFGLWATQEQIVPILNDAFTNSKNVYLIFSANKSGEFFGYARMMDLISVENEAAIKAGREDRIWQPAVEIPLSPEMKAAMLDEIEQAAKEGKQLTFEEAEAISLASTTTKTWGIIFPIQWIDMHKVPFARTTHMLNPLYENREVKVSKDGTEVEPSVGEQLVSLFKKTSNNRKGRGSVSGTTSRSNSETGDSRRSSVAGDSNSLAPLSAQRTASSRRSSMMSTRSTGSTGGGDRRPSLDPSRSQGSGPRSAHSPRPSSHRSQFGTEGYQSPHSTSSGYRSSPRHQYYGSSNTPQGLYSDHPSTTQEHQRPGWNAKTSYRGGHGVYGSAPYGGVPHMQGGYYPQEQSTNYRKGGPGGGVKYAGPHGGSTGVGGGYEAPPFNSPHNNRRQGGPQPATSPGQYRANVSPPGADIFKHGPGGSSPALGIAGQPGSHDQGGHLGGARGGGPMAGGGQGPAHPGGAMMPPHPGMYAGQGPHGAHYASFPPPGYPVMPPYMGYSYVPGPNPFMHGAMAWHPGQGPPMPGGMLPGPSMVSGHAATIPMIPGAHGEVHGMEGMVPMIGYDGLTYGYIPAEEAYHQQMYGYGYMPHDPHAAERAEDGSSLGNYGETQEEADEEQENDGETEEGTRHDNDDGDDVTTPGNGHHHEEDEDETQQQARSRSLTESTKTLTQGDENPLSSSRTRTRSSRSVSSSTVSSSSTLIPPPGGSRKKSLGAGNTSEESKEGGDHEDDDSLEISDVVQV
ncbi:hypothetical protein KI688_002871 [Linnemannia hyalina]|uniref:YTH domain-containing protein n=1 Tax=Linnemannia hyalina TaxID=64524 RepID=A0A9P8BQW1_9FUNG|nr:hypothetical protein KI688_002871 [Linnemannia hyalina]